MKRISVLALGFALMVAVPVEAQLTNFPVYATPSAGPVTYIAATYGRGLSDGSGKLDAFGAAIGRSGIADRVTVSAAAGMISVDPDNQWTFGGNVGVDLLQQGGSAQVSVQGGIGYMSVDVGGSDNLTTLHFPIGVALKGRIDGPTATVAPWIMPRISIMRSSLGSFSETNNEFGVSGGVSVTLPSGFGVHTALDLLNTDPSSWLIGVGAHYVIG